MLASVLDSYDYMAGWADGSKVLKGVYFWVGIIKRCICNNLQVNMEVLHQLLRQRQPLTLRVGEHGARRRGRQSHIFREQRGCAGEWTRRASELCCN